MVTKVCVVTSNEDKSVSVKRSSNKTTTATKALSKPSCMGAPEKGIAPAKVLGLTEYLCDKLPTPDEIYLTDSLKECLKSFDLYESDQEFQHRVNVLARLDYLAKQWIRQVAIDKVRL